LRNSSIKRLAAPFIVSVSSYVSPFSSTQMISPIMKSMETGCRVLQNSSSSAGDRIRVFLDLVELLAGLGH